jgi:tetratricopeptide (TPR) repeat protein
MMKRPAAALLIFLVSPLGSVYGQSESSLDFLDELALSRAVLDDQQDSFGSLDLRLIEPLEQLADALMQLNQFDEAHTMLDRAMQIVRVEDGLYTEIQRPLLEKKIENFANRGDWDSARENMEHLLWLYINKSLQIDRRSSGIVAIAPTCFGRR